MNIVITMAGYGRRFKNAGYSMPKYMIEAKGKFLFEWSMTSLKGFFKQTSKSIFIVQKCENAGNFIRQICEKIGMPNPFFIEIDYLTDGQATSAALASALWDIDDELLIYNIDTHVEPYTLTYEQIKGDGFIPCFNAPGNHWSFVRCDKDGLAGEVREKTRISDNCTIGLYYFKSCRLFDKLYRFYYAEAKNIEKAERYIAPMYNQLIKNGGKVYIQQISEEKVHCLGTPEELNQFIQGS
ncbi:hypothetical protein FACS1894190_16460 [Spirochaetia bacterium]|nr:hypothetical protein FACS1894190_16460 [Spirochaetia bacterium]